MGQYIRLSYILNKNKHYYAQKTEKSEDNLFNFQSAELLNLL